ncbi:MAG: response regulator [Chloroflexi bacterium]|nr:MAG: response regulator [Chloroflexota bacterium]
MTGILVPATKPLVLVVDDVSANRELLEGYLYDLGYDVRQARDGQEALEKIDTEEPDLVLLDVDMPRMDGLTLCARVKADPVRRLIPVVLITASHDRATRLKGLAAGADDFLTKPFDAKELLIRTQVLLRERALNKRLDAAESVVLALARAVESRDGYTVQHAERVALYAREMGRAYGLEGEDLDVLHKGGMLHDVGKIAVPEAVLLKPGPLDEAEVASMRLHSVEGERICRPLRSTAHYLSIVRHHHERFDGHGYPDRLAGPQIPLGARLVAIADSWDAMVSDRPYRAGVSREEAVRRLHEGKGVQWDAMFVDVFLSLLDQGLADRMRP